MYKTCQQRDYIEADNSRDFLFDSNSTDEVIVKAILSLKASVGPTAQVQELNLFALHVNEVIIKVTTCNLDSKKQFIR